MRLLCHIGRGVIREMVNARRPPNGGHFTLLCGLFENGLAG